MPYTPAHVAAVLPLRALLGRRLPLAALAIGSMAPDFVYYLPLGLERRDSHSLAGLVGVALPLGAAAYVLWRALLERPVVDLLPTAVRARLASATPWPDRVPVRVALVAAALLLGGATHLLWDACTHRGGFVVQRVEPLQALVAEVGNYPVWGYKLLQHGSTVVGCVALAWWARRWLKTTSPRALPRVLGEPASHSRTRAFARVLLPSLVLAAGVTAGYLAPDQEGWLRHLQYFAGPATRVGGGTAALALVVYSALWQVARRGAGLGEPG